MAGLAAASRVLTDYQSELSRECLEVAGAIYATHRDDKRFAGPRLEARTELLLTTGKEQYRLDLLALAAEQLLKTDRP